MRRLTRGLAAVFTVAATLVTSACASVGRGARPSYQFLERIDVATVPRDTGIMYEAQIATHVFLVDGLPAAYDSLNQLTTRHAVGAWRVIATPMFRVRQLKDSSAAVRTPSFMPRVAVERLWARQVGPIDTTVPGNPSFPGATVTGLRLTLAHHSNGQAGCFREGFEPVDRHANACRPMAGYDTNVVRLNRANGDFSSTFVNVMLHVTRMNRSGDLHAQATRTAGLAVGVDYHPPGIFGALSDEQRALYGSWRARVQGEAMAAIGEAACDDPAPTRWVRLACAFRGRSRLALEGERAPRLTNELARRVSPRILPYRVSAEASYAFDALLGAGLFVKLHDGQDYYNIGFVNRRRVVMLGAVLDLSGLDRLEKQRH